MAVWQGLSKTVNNFFPLEYQTLIRVIKYKADHFPKCVSDCRYDLGCPLGGGIRFGDTKLPINVYGGQVSMEHLIIKIFL